MMNIIESRKKNFLDQPRETLRGYNTTLKFLVNIIKCKKVLLINKISGIFIIFYVINCKESEII